MNLRDLFPEAVVNQETGQGPEWLTLPLDGQFIHFPLEALSQREQALLNLQESQPALQSSDQDV